MEKREKFETKSVQRLPHNEEADALEIDDQVNKKAQQLAEEGYKFELSIPNGHEIILKVGGRQFNFNKKIDICERIASRIRELGK